MQKKSSIKRNILQFLDFKGISKYQFYKNTEITRGVLDSDGGMSEDNTAKFIAYYPEVNIEWLITGKGDMLKEQETKEISHSDTAKKEKRGYPVINDADSLNNVAEPNISIYKLQTDYYGTGKQHIPLYEIEASAGLTTLFSNQNSQIPLDYIDVPNAPKCDGAIYVRGDSMYPILKSGDIICYKTTQNVNNIIFGEMYLLDIDNGDDQYLTVKYVQKSDKDSKSIRLVSENKYHADKDEPISNIRAFAIIKLSIRYNTIS